jgi:hypothetical protein
MGVFTALIVAETGTNGLRLLRIEEDENGGIIF